MRLSNVHIVGKKTSQDIVVSGGKIKSPGASGNSSETHKIEFDGALAFPGLINSHDHLDFNLFPSLGNRIYPDYRDWGSDINTVNRREIDEVLKIPKALRVQWGLYKNLLNGVTTVVNHGEKLMINDDLINVFQECTSLHSVFFEKNWKQKLQVPFDKDRLFVIHTGEGTNEMSAREIDELVHGNPLKQKLIGIHAVAMNVQQAAAFEALVWCPASNYFLLGATGDMGKLKSATTILFGTDSTLSASWNTWEHIRMARETGFLGDEELISGLTNRAADIWGFKNRGQLEDGFDADIVIAKRKNGQDTIDDFYAIDPGDILMILHKGEIRLFDECLFEQVAVIPGMVSDFSVVAVDGENKFVKGDLPGLIARIHSYSRNISLPLDVPS